MGARLIFIMIILINMGCNSPETKKMETSDMTGYTLKSVPFNEVKLEDKFWKPRLETQFNTLVPFALDKTIPANYEGL